jgi:hypothetical protein
MYYNDLMKNATYEQQRELSRLRALVGERKKLIEEARWSEREDSYGLVAYPRTSPVKDKSVEIALANNSSDIPIGTRERWRDIEGRIKKATEDAARNGLLIVDISRLV